MKVHSAIVAIFASVLSLSGCDKSDVTPTSSPTPAQYVDGRELFGFVDGRQFTYLQTDTVISVDPIGIFINERYRFIEFSGQQDNWIVLDNGVPFLNIKDTPTAVMLNGYWKRFNGSDSLIYFAAPTILMRRTLATGATWTNLTPPYSSLAQDDRPPFFVAYFGAVTTRTFSGIEDVITTMDGFTAYRFDVDLFIEPDDTVPVATVVEHYTPSVGLVKLEFRSATVSRSLNLVTFSDPAPGE